MRNMKAQLRFDIAGKLALFRSWPVDTEATVNGYEETPAPGFAS
ncbi:MAG: hypothetical protein U9N84_11850 [Actinomycetota bacterium]|nr:hypothetical protein [Actinomycetota bacterium]